MVSSGHRDGPSGWWRTRWLNRRNAILASARFQRFATRFPLTRPIARRRARALFDLVAGFTYSQTLYACLQAGLLDALAAGPLEAAPIASHADLPLEAAERLLRAGASIGLVERCGPSHWALGSAGAALRGNRGVAEMVAHHPLLYADLADPLALLRRGGGGGMLSRYWAYAESPRPAGEADVAAYSALMSASQPLVAEQVLDAYHFARHRRLLDIGGGEGAFLAAAARRAPRLGLGLFDLPAVAQRGHSRLVAEGLAERLVVHPGDFSTSPIPGGYDLVTLVRVLHDHDDDRALALLRSIRRSLPAAGRLLIAEPMADTPGAEPAGDAYFGLYLLAMGSGRPRSPAEITTMLQAAGFTSSKLLRTALPLTTRVIIAKA